MHQYIDKLKIYQYIYEYIRYFWVESVKKWFFTTSNVATHTHTHTHTHTRARAHTQNIIFSILSQIFTLTDMSITYSLLV